MVRSSKLKHIVDINLNFFMYLFEFYNIIFFIKMNIIIPLGGKGERFKNCGYDEPKPLINIYMN